MLRGDWERYKMFLQDRVVDFSTEKQMVQKSSKAVENMCPVKGLTKGSAYSCERRRRREMPTGSAEGPKLSGLEGRSRGQGGTEAPEAENKQDSD